MVEQQRRNDELRALRIINGASPKYRQQCMWALLNWVYANVVARREWIKDEQLSDPLHHNPLIE